MEYLIKILVFIGISSLIMLVLTILSIITNISMEDITNSVAYIILGINSMQISEFIVNRFKKK